MIGIKSNKKNKHGQINKGKVKHLMFHPKKKKANIKSYHYQKNGHYDRDCTCNISGSGFGN